MCGDTILVTSAIVRTSRGRSCPLSQRDNGPREPVGTRCKASARSFAETPGSGRRKRAAGGRVMWRKQNGSRRRDTCGGASEQLIAIPSKPANASNLAVSCTVELDVVVPLPLDWWAGRGYKGSETKGTTCEILAIDES